MKIKSAKSFRTWFKTEHKKKKIDDPTYDEDFIGTYYDKGNDRINGFYELFHGDKPNIANDLMDGLKNAQDSQAIYEFIQNAADCSSDYFAVYYNENYFVAINNGSPFSTKDLRSILNANQSTKTNNEGQAIDCSKIGRFGIGFKLVHRLVGENDGKNELVNDYKGPILFSWNEIKQFESFIQLEDINEIKYIDDIYSNNPTFFKILITNFPTQPLEKIRDIKYKESCLFNKDEFIEFIGYLKTIDQHFDKAKLNQGSLVFIKLGKGKSNLLQENLSSLKNGVSCSLNFLNRLSKIELGENNILEKLPLKLISFELKPEEITSPEDEFCPAKILFGYLPDYKEGIKHLKSSPNFYKYFPLSKENHGLNFVLHSSAFRIKTDRTQFEEDSDSTNTSIFKLFWKKFQQKLNELRENETDEFKNIYSNLLISKPLVDENNNKKWFYNSFYEPMLEYLKTTIPTKNGFSNDPQNVKINKLKQHLNLSDFGLGHIEWFEWDNEADDLLIDEAKTKLGIESWDIRDIVENADLETINNWIEKNFNNETYKTFLKELEESPLRIKTKERICQIKLFKFTIDKFASFNEIISQKDKFGKTSFKYANCFFSNNKTKRIKNELINLGLVVSEFLVEDYPNIFSSVILPDDKKHYDLIAKWCVKNANKLTAKEKKNLFLNFINETTKFDNVAEVTMKDLHLFCDSNSEIKPLNKLVDFDFDFNTPSWLSTYKIKGDEFFTELKPFLISETETLFKDIYLPNQDVILPKLTEANDIKSLIILYKGNQKQFFKEFIIKKTESGFLIVKKTNNTYQVQSADQEARKFIDAYCVNNLFVLPSEFLHYKEDDGIIKADDLHSLLLDFVDVNKHKETLVDIVKYKAKYKFLQKIVVFKFNSETTYTKEDNEFKILDLACSELKETDFQKFRNSVIIEAGQRDFKLSEISMSTDIIQISNKSFSLSKILPATYQNGNLVSDLISAFTKLGISNEKLNTLFGVNEELDIEDVFKKFTEQIQTLANREQFFFLIYYQIQNPKVDLSKLGFDLNCAVYPSEFALEKERLPKYLQNWITNKEINLSELEEIGVFTENSTLVSLRKFFLSNAVFNVNAIAEKLSSNGTMLLNTFELLKEKGNELSNDNEFSVFKEIVRVINTSREKWQELIIQDEYNFGALEEKSTEWKTINDFSIYLYNGTLPKFVTLNEIQDYIFYHYNDTDFVVNGNKIYLNENADRNKVLMEVATFLNDNNFTLSVFGGRTDETEKLKKENEELKKKLEGTLVEPPPPDNTVFKNEVKEFIYELELSNEWKDYVPELKNLLQGFNNQNLEKQKLYNLIAKIKLTKEKKVKFEDTDEYNVVKIGDEKYFVHSARGAFAYVHPSELLKMNSYGYKMALDFGKKFKTYESAEDVLKLNTDHILAYQGQKPIEELISFCEANGDKKKHLLIIDKDNANEKSRALLKLLNIEDDYQ